MLSVSSSLPVATGGFAERESVLNGPVSASTRSRAQHLLIRVAGRLFGVGVSHVLQIGPVGEIVPVTGQPVWMPGTAIINGRPLPVVDLHALLQLKTAAATVSRHWVVVRSWQFPGQCALLTDQVEVIRPIPLDQMVVPEAWRQTAAASYLQGVLSWEGKPLFVLAVDRLFSVPALREFGDPVSA